MKYILILADGPTGKSFVEWASKTRVVENEYHVVCYKEGVLPEKMNQTISFYYADPTSYSKLLALMSKTRYSMVFIVMREKEDTLYSLKNIRKIDSKVRIVLVDRWD
ncbi:MAG TPA: hypothetical protein ENK77_02505, partial [Epsilonproteobacteria bacterium]|nr:hypothetical protein [Campylobacterota bacterium]